MPRKKLQAQYEDEGEPEGDDVEHPEPEGEDPSGSVNQINQMTMCVRGKPVTVARAYHWRNTSEYRPQAKG